MGIESQPEEATTPTSNRCWRIVGLIAQLGRACPVGSAQCCIGGITKQVEAALTGALIGGGQQAPPAELGAFGGGATKKPLQAITDVAKWWGWERVGVPVAGGLAVQKIHGYVKTPQPPPRFAGTLTRYEMNEEIAARTGRMSSGWVLCSNTGNNQLINPNPQGVWQKPNRQGGRNSEPVTIRGAAIYRQPCYNQVRR